jgi:putative hydrolase of the HAD superfamily
MVMPSAILFDIGNTILLPHKNDYLAALRELFNHAINPRDITLDHFTQVLTEIYTDLEIRRSASLLEIPITTFLRLLEARLPIAFDLEPDKLIWRLWELAETLTPMPGAHATLTALKQKKIPIAALSNTVVTSYIVRRELERHNLDEFFRFVMVSADYGVRKPHPALFLTAAVKFRLPPREIWYVGDNYTLDILGAHAAGMIPIWLNHQSAPIPADAPPTLQSIATLPDILGLI